MLTAELVTHIAITVTTLLLIFSIHDIATDN